MKRRQHRKTGPACWLHCVPCYPPTRCSPTGNGCGPTNVTVCPVRAGLIPLRSPPLSASCYDGDRLYLRLSGTRTAVESAKRHIGGETLKEATLFWEGLREQRHGFFGGEAPLWRLAVPPATLPLDLAGKWLLEWGGAQRWLRSDADAATVRRSALQAGGHAILFRGGSRDGEHFQPLPQTLQDIHRRLKRAFDPKGILNPGRLYAWC